MTIRMGRKAWEAGALIHQQLAELYVPKKSLSQTQVEGEQVVVDLTLKDYEIRREKKQGAK